MRFMMLSEYRPHTLICRQDHPIRQSLEKIPGEGHPGWSHPGGGARQRLPRLSAIKRVVKSQPSAARLKRRESRIEGPVPVSDLVVLDHGDLRAKRSATSAR
jgi:hypothetical protein